MIDLKGNSGLVLLIAIYAVIIILAAFLPTTAEMTIMLMFLMALGNTGDITPSRMTIPILAMISIWGTKLPIGMGATQYITLNAFYEGMASGPDQLLSIFDFFKISIIPCALCTPVSYTHLDRGRPPMTAQQRKRTRRKLRQRVLRRRTLPRVQIMNK